MIDELFLTRKSNFLRFIIKYKPSEQDGLIYLVPTIGVRSRKFNTIRTWTLHVFFLWFELSVSYVATIKS